MPLDSAQGPPVGERLRGTRSAVLASNGMVATSQPLASGAALRVLQDGGNAADAAIAAAAVLNVVEPMMTGIGGDMFALLYMDKDRRPRGINGSGWSGSGATLDRLPKDVNPLAGIRSVTVPGAVAGWFELHQQYGALPFRRLLEPAIAYAEEGFPVSAVIARDWSLSRELLAADGPAARIYLPEGRAPRHGEVFRNPDLGRSLDRLARMGRDDFYRGELARRIVDTSDRMGGFLTRDDFAAFEAVWVEPISTTYRGFTVVEMPPNTQGLVALEMLNIMEGFDLAGMGHNSADYLHTLIEAKRLAFADRDVFVADPDSGQCPTDRLISKSYASRRRALIDPGRASMDLPPGVSEPGDTVYLTVVDRDRNVVSFINSLFSHFGSGIVVDGTGIVLHNRGTGFSLEPGHPNCLAPRKRGLHTLIPGLVLTEGRPYFSFGVMGGDMQPQGHAQVLANSIDFGMDPQAAGDAPRFRHIEGSTVALEPAVGDAVRARLAAKGHTPVHVEGVYGGYQGIRIDPESGVLMAGSDHRKDGLAIGW